MPRENHIIESPAQLDTELRCPTCGYDVRSLPRGGLCPECGSPIELAHRGDRLSHSDPLFIQTWMWGITLLCFAVAANAIGQLLYFITYTDFGSALQLDAFAIAKLLRGFACVDVVGLWLLVAIREPRRNRDDMLWFFRIAVILTALRHAYLLRNHFNSYTAETILIGLFSIGLHLLIYFRLRELAARGDERLETPAQVMMAMNVIAIMLITGVPLMPRITETPALLTLIVLVGLTGYTVVVWWKFRTMLKKSAEEARDNWIRIASQATPLNESDQSLK